LWANGLLEDYKVKLVRNYTDVGHLTSDADEGEDKMEKSAKEEKTTPQQIANKYIKIFEDDIHALNVPDADVKPRATKTMAEMIEMVKTLLDKGYAYTTELAIYFDVSKAQDYNQLSGQKLEEQIKDAGKAEVSDAQKKNPADFALWFFKAGKHAQALQSWQSPFESPLVDKGQGFPGWHLECSVMANKFLAKTIDVHMGGVEHIPIHHTNEIAQSQAANGVKFVNYWLHNEHLLVNNGKMSKSEGTGYSLEEIKAKGYNPLALRYFFLQAHYKSKQNFTWQAMAAAAKGLDNLYADVRKLGKAGKVDEGFKKKFMEYIADDFNLPQAIGLISQVLKSDLADEIKKGTLLDFDQVLGLDLDKIKEIKVPPAVKKLAEQRETARQNKDWDKADEIRKKIERAGFKVEDKPDGFEIR
jgi:cysteinyl-tRNA synthetase